MLRHILLRLIHFFIMTLRFGGARVRVTIYKKRSQFPETFFAVRTGLELATRAFADFFYYDASLLGVAGSSDYIQKKGFSFLKPFFAVRTGLEPATPGVTGRYSNQLNYRTIKFNYRCFSNGLQR